MKILKNDLKTNISIRTEKDFPKKGVEYIDIMPLIINNNAYQEIIDLFINKVKDKQIDYIVSPEARGFLFGCPVATKMNIGFIPARKKGKLPPSTVIADFEYEKEYGKDILSLPKLVENENYQGKNFYIVDDIYATGNTVQAIKRKLEELGGNVVEIGVVINIKELNSDSVYSIMEVNEE